MILPYNGLHEYIRPRASILLDIDEHFSLYTSATITSGVRNLLPIFRSADEGV